MEKFIYQINILYVYLILSFHAAPFHVALFCVIILLSCTFYIALFPRCTFSMLHFLYIAQVLLFFFSCWTLFKLIALLHVAMFSICILLLLHSWHIELFSIALCSCCTVSRVLVGLPQTSTIESFAIIINKTVKYRVTTFILVEVLATPLQFSCYIFSCLNFFILHFFNAKKY